MYCAVDLVTVLTLVVVVVVVPAPPNTSVLFLLLSILLHFKFAIPLIFACFAMQETKQGTSVGNPLVQQVCKK